MLTKAIACVACACALVLVPLTGVAARSSPSAGACPANPAPTPRRDLPAELQPYGAKLRPFGSGVLWTVQPRNPVRFTESGTWVLRKQPWFRLEEGPLTITGRRVDGAGGTFRADLPPVESYPLDLNLHIGPGFIPSSLEFSSPGCWRVTARLGDSKVVLHVPVEAAPRRRCPACYARRPSRSCATRASASASMPGSARSGRES